MAVLVWCLGRTRRRIVAAGVKGMTLAQAAQAEPAAPQRTVRVNGLERVVRAGGIETAAAPDERAQRALVGADQEPGDEPHCALTLLHNSSMPARSSLLGTSFARDRALTTISTAGSSC